MSEKAIQETSLPDKVTRSDSQPGLDVQVALQIPKELVTPTLEILQEIAAAKKKERESPEAKSNVVQSKSRWQAFWGWWKDFGSSVATLVTIISIFVGALWTLNQYIIQDRQKLEQQQKEALAQQQARIAQFASDLADHSKRNSAAYAFAMIAGKDATPLLLSQLEENAKFGKDASYQDALTRSLVSIGDSVLDPILDMNRQANLRFGVDSSIESLQVVSATQPVIYHFLVNRTELITSTPLSAIRLQGQQLPYRDFGGINLSRTTVVSSNFCKSKFDKAKMSDVKFQDVQLGESSFTNANLSGINLSGNNRLTASHFDDAHVANSNFEGAILWGSTWYYATITGTTTFINTNLENTTWYGASFSPNIRFNGAWMYLAIFANAKLPKAEFRETDLEDADFSGADLDGAKFFENPTDEATYVAGASKKSDDLRRGAFVRRANFQDAKNISQDAHDYLCRWGAVNVPGGCNGIQIEDLKSVKVPKSTGGGFCF